MFAVTAVSLKNLDTVEGMLISSDRVNDLFDTVLEIRRYEKNYFLYKTNYDYAMLLQYADGAERILKENIDDLTVFVSSEFLSNMLDEVRQYRKLWSEAEDFGDDSKWEDAVREKGRILLLTAEEMSKSKRTIKQSTIHSARKTLAMSMAAVMVIGIVAGVLFLRMLVKPLSFLENHMRKIAEGEFSLLPVNRSDREIASLNMAFNRMLIELEAKQMGILYQSEKLASLGTMVSGVAHQLNNPISNISTSCQILIEELEESDSEYKKVLLSQIEDQVQRAKALIHSLLEFSRKKDMKIEPLPLTALIDDTIGILKCDIPSTVDIEVSVSDDIWVIADKQRLQQALLNIIKNGVEAIPDEGRIKISALRNSEDRNIEIYIQDTGMGIEQEDLERICDPFYTTKADGKGSGLGLFVSREIIEAHDGNLSVKSNPGEGTTFLIELPLKEPHDNQS